MAARPWPHAARAVASNGKWHLNFMNATVKIVTAGQVICTGSGFAIKALSPAAGK